MFSNSVLIITAGGTIDKRYSTEKGTRELSFGLPAVSTILGRARVGLLPQRSIHPLDSLDMEAHHHGMIATACAAAEQKRILVTHGTDKMIETARVIARHNSDKVIVLTGASLPETMKDSDADFNVAYALAKAEDLPRNGVYIAMNGQCFDWNKCQKNEDGTFTALQSMFKIRPPRACSRRSFLI